MKKSLRINGDLKRAADFDAQSQIGIVPSQRDLRTNNGKMTKMAADTLLLLTQSCTSLQNV